MIRPKFPQSLFTDELEQIFKGKKEKEIENIHLEKKKTTKT